MTPALCNQLGALLLTDCAAVEANAQSLVLLAALLGVLAAVALARLIGR